MYFHSNQYGNGHSESRQWRAPIQSTLITSGPPSKNMTNMTEPNQLLVRSKNEDNKASQSTPNHLTEKKLNIPWSCSWDNNGYHSNIR